MFRRHDHLPPHHALTSSRSLRRGALLSLALGTVLSPAFAQGLQGDPRTTIASLAGSSSAIHLISEPGSYVLTRHLAGQAGKSGIAVTASDVTIDLNGFQIAGVPGALSGIDDGGANLENVAVQNGNVRGWPIAGISLRGTRYGFIDGVNASQNGTGLFLGTDFLVHEFVVSENTGKGIDALRGCSFLDGSARSNGTHGLYVIDSTYNEGGTLLADCDFFDSKLCWPGNEALVVRCEMESTSTSNQQFLMQPGKGSLVADCRFQVPFFSWQGVGLYPGHNSLVIDNEFESFAYGISAGSDHGWYRGNTFVACQYGMYSQGNNLITNNTAINTITPYTFGSGDTYGAVLTPSGNYFSDSRPWANFRR